MGLLMEAMNTEEDEILYVKKKKKKKMDLPMEAIMLAVARWLLGNHNAAILVGANITNG